MRIARVHIENFRCLRSFDFAPKSGINLLIGENNTGKSSLLHALDRALGRGTSFELEDFFAQAAKPCRKGYFCRDGECAMTQEEVVAGVIDALERLGIVYMVAGSFSLGGPDLGRGKARGARRVRRSSSWPSRTYRQS